MTKTILNKNIAASNVTKLNDITNISSRITPGSIICEKYIVEEQMDVPGGEADLYLCTYNNNRYVAKIYNRKNAIKKDIVDVLHHINSKYIGRIIDFGEWEGFPIEISAFYKNGSLRGTKYSYKSLEKDIIPALNEGLHELHQSGIIHKDLKPSNIMLNDNGKDISIIDFGISSMWDSDNTVIITRTGMTPEYSAPEANLNVFLNESDYYSLGITLYELYVGYTPFRNMSMEQKAQFAATKELPFPDDMPKRLKNLILGLTYADITHRNEKSNPNRRWTYDEVKKWCSGDDQPIPGTGVTSFNAFSDSSTIPPYEFCKKTYTDREELVSALAQNWENGKKQLFRGNLSMYFSHFDKDSEACCRQAEDSLSDSSINRDITFLKVLIYISNDSADFLWKGKIFSKLIDLGEYILDKLREKDQEINGFVQDVLQSKAVSAYLDAIGITDPEIFKAVNTIEEHYRINGYSRYAAFLFGYLLSEHKNLLVRDETFLDIDDLISFVQDKAESDTSKLKIISEMLITPDEKLDEQFEAWIVAVDGYETLSEWKRGIEKNSNHQYSSEKLLMSLLGAIKGTNFDYLPRSARHNAITDVPNNNYTDYSEDEIEISTGLSDGKLDYDKFVNPSIAIDKDCINIPCGYGNSDNGFKICGIKRVDYFSGQYNSIFAVVYNFLTRQTTITKKDIPKAFTQNPTCFELDYGKVFRYEMIILQMIRNGYYRGNTLNIRIRGNKEEFEAALEIVNHYVMLFSHIAKVKPVIVKYISTSASPTVGLDSAADIYVVNNSKYAVSRELWIEKRIKYYLTNDDRNLLEELLREISPYKKFREGQYTALCSMVNASDHAVCIMPTGSGKSLIYYIAALLQPKPSFVVSPTEVLIKDQIRNLNEIHHIDSVAHLKLNKENDFSNFQMCTHLIYLTPETFQNRNLLVEFRKINKSSLVAYIILDEIHCISSWGHDFRPEYLMLSKNLNKFLDKTLFLGFTATANYSVVSDIQKQLDIPSENIISPLKYEKYNTVYDFRSCDTTTQMKDEIVAIVNDVVERNERAIVFTKKDSISLELAKRFGKEADVFTVFNDCGYKQFSQGKCNILVTTEELGIGINLPNVNCTIHYGLPLSKNEYIQEVGRAGRESKKVTSYVVYLSTTDKNVPPALIKREIDVKPMLSGFNIKNNDYTDIVRRISGGDDSSENLREKLLNLIRYYNGRNYGIDSINCPEDELVETKKRLYMLYVTGYLDDFYTWKYNDKEQLTEILIDISSSNHAKYSKVSEILERMRKRSTDYLSFMGNDRQAISEINRSNTIEDIIAGYVSWYFRVFLYHYKEAFLDLLDFIQSNLEGDTEKITEEIQDFYELPYQQIKTDESYYLGLTYAEAIEKASSGIGRKTLSNIERILNNKYSQNLDAMVLLSDFRMRNTFNGSRYNRLKNSLDDKRCDLLNSTIRRIYWDCTDSGKLSYINYLDSGNGINGVNPVGMIEDLYSDHKKDIVYYGIVARLLNGRFKIFIGENRK